MKSNYSRQISLMCPTCGSRDFSFDNGVPEESRSYVCTGCELEFSYQEIYDSNQEIISRAIDETKREIMSDVKKKFKRMFK